VHCTVSAFSAWTTCTKSCGTGSQNRSRSVTARAQHGGYVCPYLQETRSCNAAACATDCVTNGFGAWTTCTKSCGTGAQKRKRAQTEPTLGGKACPHYTETRACNTFACAIDCKVADFGAWTTCTVSCNGGSQNRARPNAEPRFGGKACPHYTETRPCGMVACGCNTLSGFKAHGAHYAGFGKNYCNQCRCHSGKEVCTQRECGVHSSAQICASTTCRYGIRFGNTDEILSTTQAISAYGAGWASMGHEMTTLVKHDHRDANGGKFHCGHVMHTNKCNCFCSTEGASSHIWHRAARHADSIVAGLTSAGCKCQANWTHRGKALSGCANPSYTPNPLLDTSAHGEKREAWCKIVPGSCKAVGTHRDTVRAGGDWDTCSKMAHVHLTIPMML